MELPQAVLDLLRNKGFTQVEDHWEIEYSIPEDVREVRMKLGYSDNIWTIHIISDPSEVVIRFKNLTPFRMLNYLFKYNLYQL